MSKIPGSRKSNTPLTSASANLFKRPLSIASPTNAQRSRVSGPVEVRLDSSLVSRVSLVVILVGQERNCPERSRFLPDSDAIAALACCKAWQSFQCYGARRHRSVPGIYLPLGVSVTVSKSVVSRCKEYWNDESSVFGFARNYRKCERCCQGSR